MYDFMKGLITNRNVIRSVLENPTLDFKRTHFINTGEIIEFPVKGTLKNLEINVFNQNCLQIEGSLHQFWNGTNENDFTLQNTCTTIREICSLLSIHPNSVKLVNLECGVNVTTSIHPADILNQIICYKNKLPTKPYDPQNHVEFYLNERYIKLYNKGILFDISNLFRFEAKYMRSRGLNSMHIFTLEDLLKPESFLILSKELPTYLTPIIFDDNTIELNSLPKKDRYIYMLMKDGREWRKCTGNKRTVNVYREKRFQEIINNHGKLNIKSKLISLVENKLVELYDA